MPEDFAAAVLSGLLRGKRTGDLPAGVLGVERAGHDEVSSSQVVFERAARLLRSLLGAASAGAAPEGADLRALLSA